MDLSTLEKFSTEDLVSAFGRYNYPRSSKGLLSFTTATTTGGDGFVIPIGIWDPDTQCIYLNAAGRDLRFKVEFAVNGTYIRGKPYRAMPGPEVEDASDSNVSEDTLSIAGLAKIAKELATGDFEVDIYRDDDEGVSEYGRPCIFINPKQKSPYSIWIFEKRDEIDDMYMEYGEDMFALEDPDDDYEITGYEIWLRKGSDTTKTWEGSNLQSFVQNLGKCIQDMLLAM